MPERAISRPELAEQLGQGLELLGQAPDAHPVEVYLDYIQLLLKWNRAYNLSGIKQPDKVVSYHILDSLAVLPFLQGRACLDVGTGAGLPGFILALADPARHWVLLDSNSKKTRFLNQLLIDMQPGNVEVVQTRVEDFSSERTFTTIISRAMSSFKDFRECVAHLTGQETLLIAMKGPLSAEDKGLIETGTGQIRTETLQVPGVDAARNLVIQTNRTV